MTGVEEIRTIGVREYGVFGRTAVVDALLQRGIKEECAWDVALHVAEEFLALDGAFLQENFAELLAEHRGRRPETHCCQIGCQAACLPRWAQEALDEELEEDYWR